MDERVSEFGGLDVEMPPGAKFVYLGRPCVVIRYAGRAEAFHTSYYGMVYEYADERGQIHCRCVSPRDLIGFRTAIELAEKTE